MSITSSSAFLYCNPTNNNKTNIQQFNNKGFNALQKKTKVIIELDRLYTTYNFLNDYALLINREGDLKLYNYLTKKSFEI